MAVVSSVMFQQRQRSASSHQLVVPLYQLSTYNRRAFSAADLMMFWNSTYETLNSAWMLSDNI